MGRPLVSVVIPVYNVSRYIAACVTSVMEQSYRPIEVLMVDDGSQDNSIAIAESVLKDAEISYRIIRQKNSGVSAARNNGISLAMGELVIALDADDRLHKKALEIMVAAYEKNRVQCVACNYVLIREGRKTNSDTVENTGIYIRTGKQACEKYFHRKEIYISPAMLLNKAFLEENGIVYDEACKFAEDDLYVWEVLSKADQIAYCKDQLYQYIFHSNSTMTAANYERFCSSYYAAVRLGETVIRHSSNAKALAEIFVMRHMLGVIHAAGKVLSFRQFNELITEVDFADLYRGKMKGVGLKTRGLLFFFKISRKLFYLLCRRF